MIQSVVRKIQENLSLKKKGKKKKFRKTKPMGALLTYVYTLRTEDRMMALIEYIWIIPNVMIFQKFLKNFMAHQAIHFEDKISLKAH